jgi:hypothetical protein
VLIIISATALWLSISILLPQPALVQLLLLLGP